MAYQQIFTSYPSSLTHGRTGFSTVARSKGMSESLSALVERCGAYDVSFVSGAVFSHRILKVGARTWHVLTRSCDSGTDYTNRNNYLAHHLIISELELENLPTSADILLGWNGWVSVWDEEPRYLDDVDLSKIPLQARLPADTWARIFGDAGCAATFEKSGNEIVGSRRDSETILNLFAESLSLFVDKLDSWEISYTTCFFRNEAVSDFLWRGILDGNPISKFCANLTTRKAPIAPSSRAAQYARTGELNNREKLKLKVGKPHDTPRKFEIIRPQEKSVNPLVYVLSGLVALLGILVGVLVYLNLSAEDSSADFSKPDNIVNSSRQVENK